MSLFRMDPGPCPVCDAPHTTCTAHGEPPMTVLLSQRDAAVRARTASPNCDAPAPPPREFTSATYRRATHGRLKGTR